MTTKQQGFTLIELVAVIVILGALAVVALPRFINLQEEAEQAAVEGVAGGISSAYAVNYAGSLAADDSADYTTINATSTPDFTEVNNLMQTEISSTDYTIGSCGSYSPAEPGGTNVCTITSAEDSNASAEFTAIATSN